MKLRHAIGALTLLIVPAIAAFGQLATTENPFPETDVQDDAQVFDTNRSFRINGVITQKVSRASHSPSYLFLRIEVQQSAPIAGRLRGPVIWNVRITDPKVATVSKNCRDCLINDYTPEMQRLDVGMTVTIFGSPSRKGDPRLLATVSDIHPSPLDTDLRGR